VWLKAGILWRYAAVCALRRGRHVGKKSVVGDVEAEGTIGSVSKQEKKKTCDHSVVIYTQASRQGSTKKLLACWESTEARERVERALSAPLCHPIVRDTAAEASRCREGSSV